MCSNFSGAWFDNVGDAEVNSFVYNNSATIVDVDTTYQENSASYLTAIPGEYVTDTELETVSGNITALIPSTAGLATEALVQNTSAAITSLIPDTSNFITNSSAESTYQTIAGMTAYQPVGNYYSASNPSGFITGVDLTPYQTITGMTAYQPVMSFAYNSSNEISAINNSAIAGGGLTGDYVSGKNVLSDGYNEITSVNISGDVSVERIYDDGDLHHVYWKYSLSSIGYTLNSNSGDWNKIRDTNTLKTYNDKYEMFDHAYQPVLTDYTQDNIYHLTTGGCDIMTDNIAKIKITVESTASFLSGYNEFFNDNGNYWKLESSENGSAIYIHDENYPGSNYASIRLYNAVPAKTLVSAWYKKYDGVNLKEIGFKDDIDYLSGAIDYVSANAGEQEVDSLVHTNSSTWNTVSGKLDTTAFSTVSGTFLTAHQSLDGYATQDWVTAQGYITGVNISESAKWEEATTAYEQNSGTYLTAISIPESATWNEVSSKLDTTSFSTVSGNFLTAVDLTPYATTNDLEQVSGDITSLIPSTAGLASESYVQNNSAVLTGMIDAKQDTLTFGYDGQDKISAINNSAIAGVGSFDVVPISGTGAVDVYEQNNTLWISGKDFTSDISYISGTIGDVETLLASL